MRERFALNVCAYAFLITVVCTHAVHARDDTYDGMSAGGFIFKPTVTISEEYSDNLYTEESNEDGGFIMRVKPELKISKKDIGKNKVQVELGAEQVAYGDDSDSNYLNYRAELRTRYMFTPLTSWDVKADYKRLHSRRGDDEADPLGVAEEPIPIDRFHIGSSMRHEAGPLTFLPRLNLTRLDYDDGRRASGAIIEQDTRDRNEFNTGGRIAYDLAPGTDVFVDAVTDQRRYDMDAPSDRDSRGGDILLGMRYNPDKSILAEAAVGYMARDYDDIAFDDINTWDASARLEWLYAENSRIKLRMGRSIVEVTDAATGGAVRTDVSASISRAFTEALTGYIDLRMTRRDYEGGLNSTGGAEDRLDTLYKLGLSTDYKLQPKLKVFARYNYATNRSNLDTAEYAENVFIVGVKKEW